MQTHYTYHTLTCGLRCVHCHSAGLAEVCGVTIDAGSRDEQPGAEGLAHFVEHTIFKGTARRRAWHILNRMEAVGGELNAFTTKESTTLYSVFPRGNARRALELIADLITSSQFPQAEIDREREVVADEIDSYLDMPSEAVFDEIDETVFAGSRLAHNILGSTDTLSGFTSEICRDWLSRFYVSSRMVLFYYGNLPAARFFASAERLFATLRQTPATPLPPRIAPATAPATRIIRNIDSHQAHTIIAAPTDSMFSDKRHILGLLTNIIGGPGMNSLLNVELRERRGLVYTVEAGATLYTDSGLFTIYFGCDPTDTERCRKIVAQTLTRLAEKTLTTRQLDMARRQYLGQLTIAGENIENAALASGRATLYYGKVTPATEVREAINSITPEQLRDTAQNLVRPDRIITLTLA